MRPTEISQLRTVANEYFNTKLNDISTKEFINNVKFAKQNSNCLDGYYLKYALLTLNIYEFIENKNKEMNTIADEAFVSFLVNVLTELSIVGMDTFNFEDTEAIMALEGVKVEIKLQILQIISEMKQVGKSKILDIVCAGMSIISQDYQSLTRAFQTDSRKPFVIEFENVMRACINKKIENYINEHKDCDNSKVQVIPTHAINSAASNTTANNVIVGNGKTNNAARINTAVNAEGVTSGNLGIFAQRTRSSNNLAAEIVNPKPPGSV